MPPLPDIHRLFARLARSKFRRRFRLGQREREILHARGLDTIRQHAREIITARLAPANPPNDGRQTPMRGHPVFIAQHATATCCRKCLRKWHRIPENQPLTTTERDHIINVITHWLSEQQQPQPPTSQPTPPPTLFDPPPN